MREFLLWWEGFVAKHCHGIYTEVIIREPLFYIRFKFRKDVTINGESRTFAIDYTVDWQDFLCEMEKERTEEMLIDCVRRLHEGTARMAREGNLVNES